MAKAIKVRPKQKSALRLKIVKIFSSILERVCENSSLLKEKEKALEEIKKNIQTSKKEKEHFNDSYKNLLSKIDLKKEEVKNKIFNFLVNNNSKAAKKEVDEFLFYKAEAEKELLQIKSNIDFQKSEEERFLKKYDDFIKKFIFLNPKEKFSSKERVVGFILDKNSFFHINGLLSGLFILKTDLLKIRKDNFFQNSPFDKESEKERLKNYELTIFRLLKVIPEFDLNRIMYIIILFYLIYKDDLYNVSRNYKIGLADNLFNVVVPKGDNWIDLSDDLSENDINSLKDWLCKPLSLESLLLDPIVEIYNNVHPLGYMKSYMKYFEGGDSFIDQLKYFIIFTDEKLKKV